MSNNAEYYIIFITNFLLLLLLLYFFQNNQAPVNPFLKKSMASPQKRVGGAGDVLSTFAGSPTPNKPKLGRQSSFHAKTLSKREKHF
jgi:hypothetical protein